MCAARSALSSVTHLTLNCEDNSSNYINYDLIESYLILLIKACPALTSLTYNGNLSKELLGCMGEMCLQLRVLTITADHLVCMSQTFLQLASLLPRISTLLVPNIHNLPLKHLLGMGERLIYLDIGSQGMCCDADWEALPQNLRFLRCDEMEVGPPALPSGRKLLNSLLHLEATEPSMSLRTIAQILRAAPALQNIKDGEHRPHLGTCVHIGIEFDSSTPTDLLLLARRIETGLTIDAKYEVGCFNERENGGCVQSLVSSLPCMRRATRCSFDGFQQPELGCLLKAFPSLQQLQLHGPVSLDDAGLHELAACSQIAAIELYGCNDVSPMGLLALCKLLPRLRSVTCIYCSLMTQPLMDECAQLLESEGLNIKLLTCM